MQLLFVEVGAASEFPSAVAEVSRRGGQALLIGPDDLFQENRVELMQAALKHSLPTTASSSCVREIGGLIAYSPSLGERDARGAGSSTESCTKQSPPICQSSSPTKFELVINMNTAKALGLAIPQSLLARADEVIQWCAGETGRE